MKPFASGVGEQPFELEDIALLQAAAETNDPVHLVNPMRYKHPLAPFSAGQLEDIPLQADDLVLDCRRQINSHDLTVVEGIGGAAVPLAQDYLVSDFMAALQLPVLVVARSELGTINHSLLTAQHLRSRGLSILGFVYVRHHSGPLALDEETGPMAVTELTRERNFGIVEFMEGWRNDLSLDRKLLQLPRGPAIQLICDRWLSAPDPAVTDDRLP